LITVIARKELGVLFGSPLAWVILALAQLVFAWFYLANLENFLQVQPQLIRIANPPGATEAIATPLFSIGAVVMLMITPLLTARLIAEERRNHTLPFLISAPVSMTEIVLGKFLGLMIFLSIIIALIIALSISLLAGGSLDFGLLLSNITGLWLLSACFVALGLYISCLSTQPAIAGAAALCILFALWIMDNAEGGENSIARSLSLSAHFENFNRGMIDTFDLAYFALFIFFFLALSVRWLKLYR
jgi:ABC-2 type transport system permease protein